MQIHVTCRHMEITDSIREHAISRVEHDFHGLTRVEDVHIITDVQKKDFKCEVVVHGKDVHIEADSETEDMYKSINEAVSKASKQLRKKRDQMIDHHGNRERLSEKPYNPETGIPSLEG